MASLSDNNKRIAKNTVFLYIRMFVILAVTLYTSRVVLDKLGASDYGLYNIVGGVVGMLGFLNSTLASSTSRFITYALGKGDAKILDNTFSTAFWTHLALSIIVVALLETGGLWLIYNKLVIPPERLNAAFWVFQMSIFTCVVSITQVPYNSSVIAHEQMGVYAYVGIFEAFSKLIVAYLISVTVWDRLIYYAFLLMVIQLIVAFYYRFYCVRHYAECRVRKVIDRPLLKSLLSFSGLSFTANVAEILGRQGVIVLINLFFQPAVVAAQAIGNQITGAMSQFVNNIRTAANPQIIKFYASGDLESSKRLTLKSTVYVYYLLLLLGLPLILLMEPILNIWLVEVPPYTCVFSQFIVAQAILSNWNTSFYVPMLASGKLKKNSVYAVILCALQFVVLYVVLKCGGGVMWIPWVLTINVIIWSFWVKPSILYHDVGYGISELVRCYMECAKVTVIPLCVLIPMSLLLKSTIVNNILLLLSSVIIILTSELFLMDKKDRRKLTSLAREKLFNRKGPILNM